MKKNISEYEEYFYHLKSVSYFGDLYKKYFSSLIVFLCARMFGHNIIEIGSGIGSGVLGAFPNRVQGLDINPIAVQYCEEKGLNVRLIGSDGIFPIPDGKYDVCVLDNVLEHISEPCQTLDECYRITNSNGGLIVVVPGIKGYMSDFDHKKFYDDTSLKSLDQRWLLSSSFTIPFFFKSNKLSNLIRQYCLVAVYKKK